MIARVGCRIRPVTGGPVREVVGIARCDFAIWREIPDNRRQPTIRATQVIMHSMASPGTTPEELIRYWSQPGTPLESHFIVGRDGRAWQLVDTGRSADANYRANRRPDGTGAISIETEDNVGSPDRLPWTRAQIDTLVRLALWAAPGPRRPPPPLPQSLLPRGGLPHDVWKPERVDAGEQDLPGCHPYPPVQPDRAAGHRGRVRRGGLSVADALARQLDALATQHDELAAQVALLQADMNLVKAALGIP